MYTEIVAAAKLGVDQRPVSVRVAAAERMQFVIDDAVMIAVVVENGPMLGRRRVIGSAADKERGQPENREAAQMI